MKGVSQTAWILMAIVIAIGVGAFLWYWFYAKGGALGPFFSKQQCQLQHSILCNSYEGAGYPSEMHVKLVCKNQAPSAVCSGESDGTLIDSDYDIRTWWDANAPGCRQNYDIKIGDSTDCGGVFP